MMRYRAGLVLLFAFVVACAEPKRQFVTAIEDGCLTASGDQFILTDLEPGEPEPGLTHQPMAGTVPRPATEAYLLDGGNREELRRLVGRRIRVAGEADPAQIAEIRELSPMVRAAPKTAAQSNSALSKVEPRVGVAQHVRLEIHRLRVIGANPTGDSCETLLALR